MNLLRASSVFGMAGWRLVCAALALALWMPVESCPAGCTCTGFRIYCADTEVGITAFPELSEHEMLNITDIYIANQSNFSSINDKDLTFYRNLRNLTVTSTRLKSVSQQAFQNNTKLQYLNLKNNNLLSLSWKTVHHLNLSYLLLSGNPLQCSCENMWMKQGRGDESEAAKLMCVEEGGKRRNLSKIILPNCVAPMISKLMDVTIHHHWCIPFSVSGNPQPDLRWLFRGEPLTEGIFIYTQIHEYSEHEYHGCLQLSKATHMNNGEYTLLASNAYGSDRKAVLVHFMQNPWDWHWDYPDSMDTLYYDSTTDDTPLEPPEDRVAVYVIMGIVAVTFTSFVLMLVILKFGRNSKFGVKGFVLFHNVPVEVVSR